MNELAKHWPLTRLRLTSGDLELRWPDERDLAGLAALATGGVHDPAHMPFLVPWTDASPAERGRNTLQWFWRQRAEWQPAAWSLPFAVVKSGEVVGMQGLRAADFAVTRSVNTSSWLGLAHHGRRTGTLMRQIVLALAFNGLNAREAHSGALTDNAASLAVSRRVGYRANGLATAVRRGEPVTDHRLLLTRADWEAAARPTVHISGLEDCRADFGA